MTDSNFTAPLFIGEGASEPVDVGTTPFFWMAGATPSFAAAPPDGVAEIPAARALPDQSLGARHDVDRIVRVKPNEPWGVETELAFGGDQITYEAMWATRDNAAAFGATLVRKGEGVSVVSPTSALSLVQFDYGAFAGHQSPYQGTGMTLLPVVLSDLERHDFPHLFCSTDEALPLVISVGRYWPDRREIYLADLWVEQGDVLYIPPSSWQPDDGSRFLHGNRNSALACWGDYRRLSVETHTLLTTNMPVDWYWNAKPTRHVKPS